MIMDNKWLIFLCFLMPPSLAEVMGPCMNGSKTVSAYQGLTFTLPCDWGYVYEEAYPYFIFSDKDKSMDGVLHYEYQSYLFLEEYEEYTQRTGPGGPYPKNISYHLTVNERVKNIMGLANSGKFSKYFYFPMRKPKEILNIETLGKYTFVVDTVDQGGNREFIVFNFDVGNEEEGKVPFSWLTFRLNIKTDFKVNKNKVRERVQQVENAVLEAAKNIYRSKL